MTEVRAVLHAPDVATCSGIRDRAMLHLCFAAGLRVSELVGLPLASLTLQPSPGILVRGKGVESAAFRFGRKRLATCAHGLPSVGIPQPLNCSSMQRARR